MHAWIKLACVVLAWTILPAGVLSAGSGSSAHPVQASTRTTSISFTSARPAAAPARAALISVTAAPAATTAALTAAAAPAAATPARTYAVQRGDTLSAIATRFGVRGGWPALYAANRSVIGPDPDVLGVGVVLRLPGPATPVRYTVTAGDTLSAIAARFSVRGGWPALYAANRSVIGSDPGRIDTGIRLSIPSPATPPASGQPPGSPAPGQAQPQPQPKSPAPSPVPSAPSTAHQAHPRTHASTGMPSWLKTMLLAVGLLAVVIFAAESLLVARRRRRRAVVPAPPGHEPSQVPQDHQTSSVPEVSVMPAPAEPGRINPARIIMADHDRLVITRNKSDDTICVLRPPGQDPADILRVARLVLPEGPYGTLAEQLGVPSSWPMNQ